MNASRALPVAACRKITTGASRFCPINSADRPLPRLIRSGPPRKSAAPLSHASPSADPDNTRARRT